MKWDTFKWSIIAGKGNLRLPLSLYILGGLVAGGSHRAAKSPGKPQRVSAWLQKELISGSKKRRFSIGIDRAAPRGRVS
jgi:hypothetical protein